MNKLTSADDEATGMMMMMNWLTEPELAAAYLLIQLRGDSQHYCAHSSSSSKAKANGSSSFDDDYVILSHKDEVAAADSESVGESIHDCSDAAVHHEHDQISSSNRDRGIKRKRINAEDASSLDGSEEIKAYSLRKRKFRSIMDLYAKTSRTTELQAIPLVNHDS